MIDSIKLYKIIDEVAAKKNIVHPAVVKEYGEAEWNISEVGVSRTSATLVLHMRWNTLVTIRYKWFRRVLEILNHSAKDSGIVFLPDIETFECDFIRDYSGSGSKPGVSGSLWIHAYSELDIAEDTD